MIPFPKKLEHGIQRYLKETFYPNTKRAPFAEKPFDHRDLKFFARGAAELSQRFTRERAKLAGDYLNRPEIRAGYLLYFLPINFAKAVFGYRQIPASFWPRPNFRILDLGCGPATAGLAFLNDLRGKNPQADLEIHLVDQNKAILRDGERLLKGWHQELKFPKKMRLEVQSQNLKRVRLHGEYDLIVLHHVLNELTRWDAAQRAGWLSPLLRNHLKKNGLVLLMEPALKRPGRELMALRDRLLEPGEFAVLGPCLHEKPCPMLSGTKGDWCHFYADWREPGFLKQLDRILGNENRFLKLSYLLLGWKGSWNEAFPERDRFYRVVSNRMATRGKTELILCGKPGRIRVTRLDRHRSEANAMIDQTARGDLVEVPGFQPKGYTDKGNLRVTEKQSFKKDL